MYLRYAQRRNLTHHIVQIESADERSLKHVTIEIADDGTGRWGDENGIHRSVRISKVGSGRGRRQTSFASVATFEAPDESAPTTIDENDLRIEVKRGSGPGGQHRNTTESVVRIVHLPTRTSATAAGERSQHANRRSAMKILEGKLAAQTEVQARRDARHERNAKPPIGFAHQVRTYRLDEQTVIDHRTGRTDRKGSKILAGGLERLWGNSETTT